LDQHFFVLETCKLVIDRPTDGDADAFMYIAEPIGARSSEAIATSPVFHPYADLTEHRAALAHLETRLLAQGWHRAEQSEHALIGARFERWRDE
jgi:hypothetical protein